MAWSTYVSAALELTQKLLGLGCVTRCQYLVLGDLTLTLRALVFSEVAVTYAFAHDFSATRNAHALLRTAVGLLLRIVPSPYVLHRRRS